MSTSTTAIEWTDATWNPVRGCSRVSEGCRNCYAEGIAKRFSGPGRAFHGFAQTQLLPGRRGGWTGKVALVPEALDQPLRWRKPQRIFVNSMSDLFHEELRPVDLLKVFAVMEAAPQHTFQILTKRPESMRRWLSHPNFPAMVRQVGYDHLGPKRYQDRGPFWNSNVWIGVSVEDQRTADERIPLLLQTPAAKRFVSYEPALGPVDFLPWLEPFVEYTPSLERTPRLDWLIVGGESGPGARPFNLDWARSVVQQCRAAGVACFVKQLGKRPIFPADDPNPYGEIRDRKGGDMAEWPADLRIRQFPGLKGGFRA